MIYDLHTHSTASDGTLTPTQLVERATAAGVKVLALTDHDTLDGIPEGMVEARRQGIRMVPGVEVSVTWGGRVIHVVGLGIDPDCEQLRAGLMSLREFRSWRAIEIARQLEKAGIPGAYEGAKALSGGHLIARTHFARFLVGQGIVKELKSVFKHYLVRGRPGYVAGNWAELGEAVSWIKQAGGQAVVAHPARYRFTHSKLQRLLGEFREAGGEGMEVVSGSHNREDALAMARHAKQSGLLASAGSDYHGPDHTWVELGRIPELPSGIAPIWNEWPAFVS